MKRHGPERASKRASALWAPVLVAIAALAATLVMRRQGWEGGARASSILLILASGVAILAFTPGFLIEGLASLRASSRRRRPVVAILTFAGYSAAWLIYFSIALLLLGVVFGWLVQAFLEK